MTTMPSLSIPNGSHSPPIIRNENSSDPGLFSKHQKLIDWVLDNGGYLHPNVDIAYSSSKGYHMLVARDRTVTSQTRVTSCPMPCTLSVLNVLNIKPFSDHGTRFPPGFLYDNVSHPELLQAFFLMEQVIIEDDSWWAPYIRTLPTVQDVNGLQFESEDDQKWLTGTNLAAGLSQLMDKWKELYEAGLKQLQAAKWPSAVDGRYTWELYRWAATMFGSRGFASAVLSDTTPAEQARLGGRYSIPEVPYVKELFTERFSVLLPLMDILNHRPKAQVDWQPRNAFVGLQIREDFEAGEEVCNNYGPRDNGSLLLSYGFIIPDNPFDHTLLSIRTPPQSLLTITRLWEADPRSNATFSPFLLDIKHHKCSDTSCFEASVFGYDLLDIMSVLSANDREGGAIMNNKRTLMSMGLAKPHGFDDFRNMLGVIGDLQMQCDAGLRKIEATSPSAAPATSKQRNAKAYRDIQYRIYSIANDVCKQILLRAISDTLPEAQAVVPSLKSSLTAPAQEKLQTLLNQHAMITLPGELLTVEAFLTMLPQAYQDDLQDTLQNLAEHCHYLPATTGEYAGQPKSRSSAQFAFLISAAYHLYSRGVKLPRRLSEWVEKISAWYPPDSEEWSYVPEPGPWERGSEPPPGLMDLLDARDVHVRENQGSPNPDGIIRWQWLKRKSLCWGWNVMHEERVGVSKDVMKLAGYDVDSETGPKVSLLYVNASQ
jgi:hypothetical protein